MNRIFALTLLPLATFIAACSTEAETEEAKVGQDAQALMAAGPITSVSDEEDESESNQIACNFEGNNDPTVCLRLVKDPQNHPGMLLFQYSEQAKGQKAQLTTDFKIIVRPQDGGDDDEIGSTLISIVPGVEERAVPITSLPYGSLVIQGQGNGNGSPGSKAPKMTGAVKVHHLASR